MKGFMLPFLGEVGTAIAVLAVVFGSMALVFWIGGRLRGRPSKKGPIPFIDPRMGQLPTALPDLFDERTMYGNVRHGERIADVRVTSEAPVDPMLSDPIDQKPKDLRS
ncbi:MAG: hypothetical protein JSS65_04315 [Armatimonadetes bacterium]|nr:hypothetical protein [Armatimonadota bacterium]